MLAGRRLVVDTMCEVHKLLTPYINEEFWDFSKVKTVTGSIYIFGRQHLLDNLSLIREMAMTDQYVLIFDNSAEGSWTLESQIRQLHVDDLVTQGRLLIIAGAPISDQYPHVVHEHLLTTILDYEENVAAQVNIDDIFNQVHKPYDFLFLNGRGRPHRKYLYERLRRLGALNRALWTMLDNVPTVTRWFQLVENGVDVLATPSPLRRLPTAYEVDRYRTPDFGPILIGRTFLKQELFNREWGEIYLEPAPYKDTYFSLVTETVCAESDFSFRTEKIAKPLAMGHPFIVAANNGFYRDLHNLGFKTFHGIVDESFDTIVNAQDRMDRLIDIVTDLCRQNLPEFLAACRHICKYNQDHLTEFVISHRARFPKEFGEFITRHA